MLSKLRFILLLFFITSCVCPRKYYPQDPPPPLPTPPQVTQPVGLALVLGGGGARGLAHVGVIEEFEKAGLQIDLIVGCSAGSLAGALYADCPNSERLKALLPHLKTEFLMDINIWKARFGLCQGRSLRKFLSTHLSATTFEELKIPFYSVTTDLCSGELVALGGGPLAPAVEASCSIPMVFAPVELHGRIFVDGGVVAPVPVSIARQFSPRVIVAVDLQRLLPRVLPSNLFGIGMRSAEIALLWQTESCLEGADVVIRPVLEGIGIFDDQYADYIYQAGKEAAKKQIPMIKKLMEEATTPPDLKVEQSEHTPKIPFHIRLKQSFAIEPAAENRCALQE